MASTSSPLGTRLAFQRCLLVNLFLPILMAGQTTGRIARGRIALQCGLCFHAPGCAENLTPSTGALHAGVILFFDMGDMCRNI